MSTWLHCGDVNGARVELTVFSMGSVGKWGMTYVKWASDFWHSLACMRIMKAHECRIAEVNSVCDLSKWNLFEFRPKKVIKRSLCEGVSLGLIKTLCCMM